MARGWESKSIEAQQDLATSGSTSAARPPLSPEERAQIEKRRSLELARARAEGDLARATRPAHRQMLQEALDALDQQLASLKTTGS